MTAEPPSATGRSGGHPPAGDIDAVLLCAGIGQRLRPLTNTIPKALVPVAGRPIVEYHLEAWRAVGVDHAILVTGYREDQLRAHVGDGARFGVRVEYVSQSELRGSGDALLAAAPRLQAPSVLVGYCDVYFQHSLAVWTALLTDRTAKIVGAEVPNAANYGRLVVDGPQSRLLEIREKDGKTTPGLVNAGAYLLPRQVVELLRTVPPSPRGEIELTDAVTAFARQGGEVWVVATSGWVDVGTPEHLELATTLARAATSQSGPSDRPARAG